MDVIRRNFDIIPDNEETFFALLLGAIESRDELASVQLEKHPINYSIRIAPSIPVYYDSIIENIVNTSNMFGVRLDFSKSIKTTGVIYFKIIMK